MQCHVIVPKSHVACSVHVVISGANKSPNGQAQQHHQTHSFKLATSKWTAKLLDLVTYRNCGWRQWASSRSRNDRESSVLIPVPTNWPQLHGARKPREQRQTRATDGVEVGSHLAPRLQAAPEVCSPRSVSGETSAQTVGLYAQEELTSPRHPH